MTYWEIILIAFALCVDTLAVTVSSSLTLKSAPLRRVVGTALAFGTIQALLLFAGWACGASVFAYIYKVAGWVGFAMLLYIGGSMLLGALRGGGEECRNLTGLKAVLMAGVATSIDASAVGVSFAMTRISVADLCISLAILFAVTTLTALTGICGGCRIGRRFGRPAQIVGGAVLIAIGVRILLE